MSPRLLAAGLAFPEGPAFAPDGTLWCVELQGGALVEMAGAGPRRHPVGGAPNGLAFAPDGTAWFCDAEAGAIRRYDHETKSVSVVAADPRLDRPNDLAFDGSGRLVFTCPGNSRTEPTGTVWSFRRDEGLRRVAEGLYFPNGLAFAPGSETLVIAETYRHRLWRGAYDGMTGTWTDAGPWAEVGGPTGPDGMAFGIDGTLHVAVFGSGQVKAIAHDGALVGALSLPGARPTNCAFDPSGVLGLVVTEAERGEVWAFPAAGLGIPLAGGWHD